MRPQLNGFDHIHVYVSNREDAAAWYEKVLGFKISKALEIWAKDQHGPLTIEDPTGKIHLALFSRDHHVPSTAVAFNANGQEFVAWKSYLEQQNILLRCSDHQIAWSLYFNDLDKNLHEITTYHYDYVSSHLDKKST